MTRRFRFGPVFWMLCLGTAVPVHAGELVDEVRAAELGRTYDDALLRRAAGAEDAATRRSAARAAGRLKDERAVGWLLGLLNDEAGPLRRAALFALGQIGGSDRVVPLRSALDRLPRADVPVALEALGKTRDARAVAAAVAHLYHPDAAVRGEAAIALFRLADASALPDVLAALAREDDDEVRWRQVYTAWRLLRERARAAAGEGTPAPVPVDDAWAQLLAEAALPARPANERVFAVRALGWIEGRQPMLRRLARDADPRVVQEAARGLGRPWDEACGRTLLALLGHEDELVREAALATLAAHRKEAGPLLARAATLLESVPRLRVAALAAAAEVGAVGALPADSPLGEEAVWRVNAFYPDRLPAALPRTRAGQVAAAEVCATEQVPPERALAVLRALLDVDDFVVRTLAIGGLAKRGNGQDADAIVAAARGTPGTANLDVRVAAAEALAERKRYDPWLREAALDPDAPVRAAARATLKALGLEAPVRTPVTGFRLRGLDAAGVAAAARELRGTRVRLETSRGTMVLMLLPDEAPAHCVNFAGLVADGFYDGLTWHRVVGNFVIQGGCPRGDGWGGPGYLLPDEIGTRPYVRGTVGMPKAGDDTGGCQIFITHLPTPHLDGRYTVYAQVIEGLAVLDAIRVGDTIVRASLQRGR